MKRKIRELNSHIKYKNLQNTYKIKLSATPERMLCRDLPLSSVQEAVGQTTTNLTIESLPSRGRETAPDFVVRAKQPGPRLQGEVSGEECGASQDEQKEGDSPEIDSATAVRRSTALTQDGSNQTSQQGPRSSAGLIKVLQPTVQVQ